MTRNNAADCVRSFMRCRRHIGAALAGDYPQFPSLQHVLEAVRAGELERKAQSGTGFTYSVHGRGCLMAGPDGAQVDLDLLLDGSEAFDVWRLEVFARSVGMSPIPPKDALVQECYDLVQRRVLEEPEPGWFRLVE
ncbi:MULTISPECIES: DUF6896 domain-containing protein [unclassified Streptomyces]|uniref:DUF6896 domain-containing protein n=1 Tax=unclassified Streptomyces TaxID=2593676 RepID=UPI00352F9CB7